MLSNCFLDHPLFSLQHDKHCNCRIITNLRPFHVFLVSRPKCLIKEKMVSSDGDLSNFTPPIEPIIPFPIFYSEISSSELAKLYLVIVDKQWTNTREFQTLLKIIEQSSFGVKEILFYLLKREYNGVSKYQESYSQTGIRKLILGGHFIKKENVFYRKKIVGDFYIYKLKTLKMDNIKVKVKGKENMNDRRKNFILHYFKDFLNGDKGSAKFKKMLLDVFNTSNSEKTLRVHRIKSTIRNISHLRYLLPKSDLMKADLIDFAKNQFMYNVLRFYDQKTERFIHNLLADYNSEHTTQKDKKFEAVKFTIQFSRKFDIPWVKRQYLEAVNHVVDLVEGNKYLKYGY